jgi:hypothetical protein
VADHDRSRVRLYDGVMFIGAPLLALALGIAISGTPLTDDEIVVWGNDGTVASIFIGSFIMAHLGLVVVRSHLNQQIFARTRGASSPSRWSCCCCCARRTGCSRWRS